MGTCPYDASFSGTNIIMNFKSNLTFYITILIYKAFLDFSYVNYITEVFFYSGYVLDYRLSNYIISWILVIAMMFIVPYSFSRISDWFLNFYYLLVIIPIACMYGLDRNLPITVILINLLGFAIIYLILNIKQFKAIKTEKINGGESFFLYLCVFMTFYLLFWYVGTGAISNFNLDLAKVYEYRELNSDLTNIGVASYVNNWVYQVFSLALLGYGFLKKNYIIISFSMISQFIFFGVSGHKSVLFSIFMIAGLYYYFKISNSLIIVPVFLSILILVCLVIFYNDNYSIYPSIFIRRFIFVPAQLSYAYIDFFQNNPPDLWARSFLSSLNETNYPDGVSKTIGNYLGSEASANNGFISSGYAQGKIFGVILYSTITGWLLKYIDHLASSNSFPLWFSLLMIVNPLKNLLLSSDLFTVLLTHGLLVSILLLILLNNPERDTNAKDLSLNFRTP